MLVVAGRCCYFVLCCFVFVFCSLCGSLLLVVFWVFFGLIICGIWAFFYIRYSVAGRDGLVRFMTMRAVQRFKDKVGLFVAAKCGDGPF